MIISHRYKFIFLKTKKVAGTSLEIALSKHCGKDDVISCLIPEDEKIRVSLGYPSAQNYLRPVREWKIADVKRLLLGRERIHNFRNHTFARDARQLVPKDVWDNYTKVSVVRNPYDYAISMYFWRRKYGYTGTIEQYLFQRPEELLLNRRITQIDGKDVVDFWVRYESFESDLTELSRILDWPENIYEVFRDIQTKGGVRPRGATTREVFSDFPDGVKLIELLCRDGIERYGYRPFPAEAEVSGT